MKLELGSIFQGMILFYTNNVPPREVHFEVKEGEMLVYIFMDKNCYEIWMDNLLSAVRPWQYHK